MRDTERCALNDESSETKTKEQSEREKERKSVTQKQMEQIKRVDKINGLEMAAQRWERDADEEAYHTALSLTKVEKFTLPSDLVR